jgi:predicted RecA/RadA family phage recombinase
MGDHLPTFAPGRSVTYTASAAVTGGRLVRPTGDRLVAHATDAGLCAGVASRDAAIGEGLTVQRGGVHELTATATAIAHSTRVVAAADGKVRAYVDGTDDELAVIGHTIEAIAGNAAGLVQLYQ